MNENFTCECCGETFEKMRPDDEACDEDAKVFGVRPDPQDTKNWACVCDDCFRFMLARTSMEAK
jgi:hypothetical protein